MSPAAAISLECMGPTIDEDHILYDRTLGHTQQKYVRQGIEASTEYLHWS